MSSQTTLNLVIGVAVLALLIFRQLRARPVRGNQRLVLVLVVIGLIEAVQYMQKLHSVSVAIVALAGSLVLAAVFGAARAATVRLWVQDGQPWAQGNLLTAALWVLALAAHLGYDYLVGQHKDIGGIGTATVILYLAVSLGVQRLIVTLRAQRLDPVAAGRVGRVGRVGPGAR
jgi:FtsH-binding integral membrane protein